MTQRERQILNWIEENPLISQQELAEKAGITRSSVAVHISNLMKKGYITGKGYIVHTAPYVTVVGGVNMDIGGWPSEVPVGHDSNPGAVRMSLGGVGRNIAHNMSLLGLDVRMVTAFGDDLYAQKIAASCGELGIDISQSPVIPEGHTSTYLFINDEKGDMLLAVSDMDIYRHLTPQLLSQRQKLLSGSQVLVIDTNIPAESIAYLAENCHVPIFADPVSTAKAVKLQPVLGRLHTLKPNRMEAELLSGVAITDEDSLNRLPLTPCWTPACTGCSSPWGATACSPPTGPGSGPPARPAGRRWSTPPAAGTPSWRPSPGPICRARTWRTPPRRAWPPPPSPWRAAETINPAMSEAALLPAAHGTELNHPLLRTLTPAAV